jgi:DNA-binding response OmpR family regulator
MEWTPLKLGELAIDPEARSATLEGVPVRLTTVEFRVLEALARSAGRVQGRASLTYQALGRRLEPFDRSIDAHISNIRRKTMPRSGARHRNQELEGATVMCSPFPASGLEKHLRPAPEPRGLLGT